MIFNKLKFIELTLEYILIVEYEFHRTEVFFRVISSERSESRDLFMAHPKEADVSTSST